MKPILLIELAAMAMLPIMASCNRNEFSPATSENNKAQIRVSLKNTSTKASAETLDGEAKVNNLQVFVFRGEEFNEIDAYASASDTSSIILDCTSGPRQIWAFVNCPDLSGKISKEFVMETPSYLSQNSSVTGFQMTGSEDKTINGKDNVTIDVNRIASRVVLRKLTKNFKVESLNESSFSVSKVFLLNAATSINYDMTNSTCFFNETEYDISDNDKEKPFLVKTGTEFASAPGVYDKPLYLYVYPNDIEENGATCLVVETLIDGLTYYYPIVLPELKPNKSYEINDLVITRLGSDSPDQPVTTAEVNFSINVLDWTQVLVSSDGKEDGTYEI